MATINLRLKLRDECRKELGMRRSVWKRIPGSYADFLDTNHKERYRLMLGMEKIFNVMTDAELNMFIERIRKQELEPAPEQTLF